MVGVCGAHKWGLVHPRSPICLPLVADDGSTRGVPSRIGHNPARSVAICPLSDRSAYRQLRRLVASRVEDAPIHAAMRADELMAMGDLDDQAIWKLILKAIDELLAKDRPEDAGLH